MRVCHLVHGKAQLAGNGHSLMSKALFKSCNPAVAYRLIGGVWMFHYTSISKAETLIQSTKIDALSPRIDTLVAGHTLQDSSLWIKA